MVGKMSMNEQIELVKRDSRRRRRRKTQIISCLIAVVIVLLVLTGLAVGGIYGVNYWNLQQEKKAQLSLEEEQLKEQLEQAQLEQEQLEQERLKQELLDSQHAEEEEVSVLNQPLEDLITSHLADMALEDKIAGLFMVTPEALTGVGTAVAAGNATKEALLEYSVGGVIYFAKNIKSQTQLKEMIQTTNSYSKYPLFIGVDEEGGTVSRLANANLGIEKTDPMATIGETEDITIAKEAGTSIGTYLAEYGFNVNFAPVADVTTVEDNPIGNRSFGSDPIVVSEMVTSYISGLQSVGVSGAVKHFPGHGHTTQDSHDEMATTDKTLEEMKSLEFIPFVSAIQGGVDFVMVGHISAPNIIGDNTPSSVSSMMINEVLRNQLEYDGIVITDALNMKAITSQYNSAEAAVLTIQAGADMILMPDNFQMAYYGVLEAVENGKITEERIEESLRRIYRVKYAEVLED